MKGFGKSRRRAALDAGYSLSSANNPGHNIERGRVREVFAELIRSTVPPELIVRRIREGLDATETRVFAYKGRLIYSRLLINYSERPARKPPPLKFGQSLGRAVGAMHSSRCNRRPSFWRPPRRSTDVLRRG